VKEAKTAADSAKTIAEKVGSTSAEKIASYNAAATLAAA
jgi:hypothetical protein